MVVVITHAFHSVVKKGVCMRAQSLQSCLTLTLWTTVCQAPLSMGSSRQEFWSGLPWPPRGDLPKPGTESESPVAPALQADSSPLSHWGSPCEEAGHVKRSFLYKREYVERDHCYTKREYVERGYCGSIWGPSHLAKMVKKGPLERCHLGRIMNNEHEHWIKA